MRSALLLSGGMDSLSIAWWKRPDQAITIDYGQLAADAEIEASRAICSRLEIPHQIIRVDCRGLGSGDMSGGLPDEYAPATDWWPYRNQLLITMAAMKGIGMGVTELWIGTVQTDELHRDGTPEFLESVSALLKLQEGQLTVKAPAITLSTVNLVRESGIPMEELSWAHSCHKSNVACANCRGCNKYFEVLRELNSGMD